MSLQIGSYTVELPPWWGEVEVEVPDDVDADNVVDFARETYGRADGTEQTWREALKFWALVAAREQLFPVYIAHCYRSGGQHAEAAKIYADLHALSQTQGDDEAWYDCYLAYNAGQAWAKAGDLESARRQLEYAAGYVDEPDDDAVRHYAELAAELLAELGFG